MVSVRKDSYTGSEHIEGLIPTLPRLILAPGGSNLVRYQARSCCDSRHSGWQSRRSAASFPLRSSVSPSAIYHFARACPHRVRSRMRRRLDQIERSVDWHANVCAHFHTDADAHADADVGDHSLCSQFASVLEQPGELDDQLRPRLCQYSPDGD